MYLVRILLVMLLTFSASLSNAMDTGHMPVSDHTYATVEDMADAQPLCCQDSTECAQTCHALLALLPTLTLIGTATVAGEDVFCTTCVLLTGFEPSGPLDPPRAV